MFITYTELEKSNWHKAFDYIGGKRRQKKDFGHKEYPRTV